MLPQWLTDDSSLACTATPKCTAGSSRHTLQPLFQRAFATLQKSGFREQPGDFIFPDDGLKGRSNSVTWEALLKITLAGVISSPVGWLIINGIHMLPVTWLIESMCRSVTPLMLSAQLGVKVTNQYLRHSRKKKNVGFYSDRKFLQFQETNLFCFQTHAVFHKVEEESEEEEGESERT